MNACKNTEVQSNLLIFAFYFISLCLLLNEEQTMYTAIKIKDYKCFTKDLDYQGFNNIKPINWVKS